MKVILDTDIGGDADDALALALCLRHPEIELVAVTTVSGDAEWRAGQARDLLRAAGVSESDVPVAVGFGEERGSTDGVDVLAAADTTTTIATIGSQSNLAAAVDRRPGLQIQQLAVMGGVFRPLLVHGVVEPPDRDYNLNVDQAASVRALNAGLPTLYVPCDVTFNTYLTAAQVDRLRAGDDLGKALAAAIDRWTPTLREYSHGRLPADHLTMMHDPLTVAVLVERSFVTVERMPVTVAMHEGHVRTFVDPIEGRDTEVVTGVDPEAFAEWWLATVLGE